MENYSNNKNKIELNDYPFELDVSRRMAIVQFTPFERDLFYEIVLGSLEIQLSELADDLDVDVDVLETLLKHHLHLNLFRVEGSKLIVNKEERKHFEVELEKFNDSFEPNIQYLKSLFNKIPIDLLPKWFSLPKICEAIFPTIVDKHFATPKIYERYLEEMEFERPSLNQLMKELYASPNLALTIEHIKATYPFEDIELYKVIAFLEFNLIAVHSFIDINNSLVEVITPIHEYRMFHLEKLERKPIPLNNEIAVFTIDNDNLPRVTKTLKKIDELTSNNQAVDFQHEELKTIRKLLEIDLLDAVDEQVILSSQGKYFLDLNDAEKSLFFLRYPKKGKKRLLSEGVQKQIERDLIQIKNWTYLDDFIDSLSIPLDGHAPLELIKKGRNYHYSKPNYTPDEKIEIRQLFCDYLAMAGVIDLGNVEGKTVFRLTPFGKQYLH
jgi:hypothetical protein